MPIVKTTVQIPETDLATVWRVVRDFEQYPSRMPDVVAVSYLSGSTNSTENESEWKVLLNGSELTWTERDFFEPNDSIRFEQIEGDLEVWQGLWTLSEQGNHIIVDLEVEFDLGIPSLAEILNPVAVQAIRSNSLQMLSAIKEYSVISAP